MRKPTEDEFSLEAAEVPRREDLSPHDRARFDEELRVRLKRAFALMQEILDGPTDVALTGATAAQLRRKSNRLVDAATDNGAVDENLLEHAYAYSQAADAQEALQELKHESREMVQFIREFSAEQAAKKRELEAAQRKAARAAGEHDVVRELNRTRRSGARGRAKKK